jgi:hypothetical protein
MRCPASSSPSSATSAKATSSRTTAHLWGSSSSPNPVSAPSVGVQQDSSSARRWGSSSSPTPSSLHLSAHRKTPHLLVFGAAATAAPRPHLRSIRQHAARLLIHSLSGQQQLPDPVSAPSIGALQDSSSWSYGSAVDSALTKLSRWAGII